MAKTGESSIQNTRNFLPTTVYDAEGNPISVDADENGNLRVVLGVGDPQNPQASNSDSVYSLDIDTDNSDNGGFVAVAATGATGGVTDYFDSLVTVNEDTTLTDPKVIYIKFFRSIQVQRIGLGCDDITKNFSNIKVELLGSADIVRKTIDLSSDSTKRNSLEVEFDPDTANAIRISFLTTDPVALSNLVIYKSLNRIVTLQGLDKDGSLTDVTVDSNGGLNVNLQDQTTDVIGLFLGELLDTISIITNTSKDDEIIDIETTGAVPTVGDYICLQEDGKITQEEVISVVSLGGNQYTVGINIPLDYSYTTAGGCSLLNVDMNVDGSGTPVDFKIGPIGDYRWDITRMIISMVLSSSGDDGKFGNLSPLTTGVYFRKEDSQNSQNLFNAKENSDFAVEGYDIAYPIRSGGGGDYGMRSRISFGGQDKRGVVIRLDGSTTDTYRATIRDDLTGLGKFRIKAQGHVVED